MSKKKKSSLWPLAVAGAAAVAFAKNKADSVSAVTGAEEVKAQLGDIKAVPATYPTGESKSKQKAVPEATKPVSVAYTRPPAGTVLFNTQGVKNDYYLFLKENSWICVKATGKYDNDAIVSHFSNIGIHMSHVCDYFSKPDVLYSMYYICDKENNSRKVGPKLGYALVYAENSVHLDPTSHKPTVGIAPSVKIGANRAANAARITIAEQKGRVPYGLAYVMSDMSANAYASQYTSKTFWKLRNYFLSQYKWDDAYVNTLAEKVLLEAEDSMYDENIAALAAWVHTILNGYDTADDSSAYAKYLGVATLNAASRQRMVDAAKI